MTAVSDQPPGGPDPSAATCRGPPAQHSQENAHVSEVQALFESKEILFPVWFFQLTHGFNLLLHGYGSKRLVLKKFCESPIVLETFKILVVDGCSPRLTVDRVLAKIYQEYLLQYNYSLLPSVWKNGRTIDKVFFVLNSLEDLYSKALSGFEFIDGPPRPLLIAVMSIDGFPSASSSIKEDIFQEFLFSLSFRVPQAKIIATFEHINSSFLFSPDKMGTAGWIFHDTTTFIQYDEELGYSKRSFAEEASASTNISDRQRALNALTVLGNLTAHSRRIFGLLLQIQYKWASVDPLLSPEDKSLAEGSAGPPSTLSKISTCRLHGLENSPSVNTLALKLVASPSRAGSTPRPSGKRAAGPVQAFPGITFTQYFHLSMENFLASNESTFRTILGEFFDHGIMASRLSVGNEELIHIPFNLSTISAVAEGLSNMDKS